MSEVFEPYDGRLSLELCGDGSFLLCRDTYCHGDEVWEEWQGKVRRTEGSELRLETEEYTSGDRGSFGLDTPAHSEPGTEVFLLSEIEGDTIVIKFDKKIIPLERVKKRMEQPG